jgi:hypothetical protein
MRQVRTRSMDDMGLRIPVLMPQAAAANLTKEVLDHASITRGEGLRHARREIAQDRGSTLRVILSLLKVLVIPRTEEIVALSPQLGMKIECGPGCNACCYQNVEVSIPEAILVALQVADPNDSRRAIILQTADADADLDSAARARTGIPCPLLVDGQCSVYENRPLLCRATLSPCAKACYDVLEGKDVALQIYWGPQFFAIGDKDALRGICKDLDLQYDNVDLVQTVAAILRDPTTVTRWAAGEVVFNTALKEPTAPVGEPGHRATAPLPVD